MSKESAKRRRLLCITAAAAAVLLICIGSITAYFTDVDIRDNVITIGKTDLELTEDPYTDSKTIVPGSVVEKAPKLKNTGNIGEYVFMKVEVPKASVTLLYEEDDGTHNKGTVKVEKSVQQIFKILTENGGTNVNNIPNGQDVTFNYHACDTSTDGWVLLNNYCDFSDTSKDIYVFGYSKQLAKDQETVTLFDKVQLKSFIDHEIHSANAALTPETITVTGMCIQTKNLGLTGIDDNGTTGTTDTLDETQLQAIYEIVKRKADRT